MDQRKFIAKTSDTVVEFESEETQLGACKLDLNSGSETSFNDSAFILEESYDDWNTTSSRLHCDIESDYSVAQLTEELERVTGSIFCTADRSSDNDISLISEIVLNRSLDDSVLDPYHHRQQEQQLPTAALTATMASRSLYRSVLNSSSNNSSDGHNIGGSTPNSGKTGYGGALLSPLAALSPGVYRHHMFGRDFSPVVNLSPVSSLALDLNSANLSSASDLVMDCCGTPTRRLSLSSTLSTSAASIMNSSASGCSIITSCPTPQRSMNRVVSSHSYPPAVKSASRMLHHLSCSFRDSIQASTTGDLSDIDPLSSPTTSPSVKFNKNSSCSTITYDDKENAGCPPGTPPKDKKSNRSLFSSNSNRGGSGTLRRRSPLKDIVNVSRSLCFGSPPRKEVITPAKKPRNHQLVDRETSPPDEPDASSRDSGYSESATKCEDMRLRESVACAPRKLNLDTPTKVRFGRLHSISTFHNNTSNKVTVMASKSISAVSQNNTGTTSKNTSVSPNSLVAHNSNFPLSRNSSSITVQSTSDSNKPDAQTSPSTNNSSSELQSTEPQLRLSSPGSAASSKFPLTSLITQSNNVRSSSCTAASVEEADDDYYMHDLYSLEECDEENIPSSVPKLGALLSGPVMDTSLNSSIHNEPQSNDDEKSLSAETVVAANVKTEEDGKSPSAKQEAENVSSSSNDNSKQVTIAAATSTSNYESTSQPTTPQPSDYSMVQRGRTGRRFSMLACQMDVSPHNPQTRPPIRRTLSLFDVSPSSIVQQKEVVSPNCGFKRPLPRTEMSPFVDTKRHKAIAVGGTPQIDGVCFRITPNSKQNWNELPIPLPQLTDLSPSPCKVSSSPVLIPGSEDCMPEQSDASPDFVLATRFGQVSSSSNSLTRTSRVQPSYHLGPRQYSAPVTAGVAATVAASHNNVDVAESETSDRDTLSRTHSESHLAIMKAVKLSEHQEEELTGDFCLKLCLPIVNFGRHPDIKSISPETMGNLIRGQYNEIVCSYEILDCRYPYEYEGGHIIGADSWHSPQFVVEQVEKASVSPPARVNPNQRNILIFHCEFSAERGPRAQRLLREKDRISNKDRYPYLHYPEVYLLEGGYKAFFEQYPEMCIPRKYMKMIDDKYVDDLKLCRSKSKTWAAENRQAKGRTGLRAKKYSDRR